MLEHDFTELDNDFITLWSKYIVMGEQCAIYDELTKLAELGQINAVQSWYLFANPDVNNPVIDAHLQKYGKGPNELLAKAHYYYHKERITEDEETIRQHGPNSDLSEVAYNNIQLSNYWKLCLQARKAYLEQYGYSHNILFAERFCELSRLADTNTYKKDVKYVRKVLLQQYNKGVKSPQISFALGKNLILFKDFTSFKWQLGLDLLLELSKRELSATLQNYTPQGERLIKQQVDKIINNKVIMKDDEDFEYEIDMKVFNAIHGEKAYKPEQTEYKI